MKQVDVNKRAEISREIKNTRESLDRASLEYLISDRRGRWFMQRIFRSCHLYEQTFSDSDSTNEMLLFEGERRIALNIRKNIMMLPGGMDSLHDAEREEFETETHFEEMMKKVKEGE